MPMKMGWRWYGEGNDPVTLSDIKQIPGVTSIVILALCTLYFWILICQR